MQLFPDVSLAEIRAATGFSVAAAADLRTVRPPSAAEVAAVRSVDPLGVRKSEFSPPQLARTFEPRDFEQGAGPDCAC